MSWAQLQLQLQFVISPNPSHEMSDLQDMNDISVKTDSWINPGFTERKPNYK